MALTPNFSIVPAREASFPAIRALIRQAQINPMGLNWRRFRIAEDSTGQLIGCGQIKTHADGTFELASIAVLPNWRGKGVARAIIESLINENPRLLYLTCRTSLGSFYQQFGFTPVTVGDLPPYFRRIQRLSVIATKLGVIKEQILVMQRKA